MPDAVDQITEDNTSEIQKNNENEIIKDTQNQTPVNIKASDYTAYVGVKNEYSVILSSGDVPLSNKNITFTLNGKEITNKTDDNGKTSIFINENTGIYTLHYTYDGDNTTSSFSGSVEITVKQGVGVKITKYYSKVYRNKKAGKFKVKLTDAQGNVLKSQKVKFKLNGKTYSKKTNANGIATVKVKLKIGSYKIKVSFSKTSTYNSASKTYKIKVKPKQARNNGMWLFGRDMESVNLDKLQKYGFKQVFLNFKAIELYGKSGVEKWVKDAKSHGIKVHLWMQVFYSGGK